MSGESEADPQLRHAQRATAQTHYSGDASEVTSRAADDQVVDVDLPLVIRPRKIARYGAVAAAVVLATMIALAATMQSDGIQLRLIDKIGFGSVGVFGAAAIMLVARPRVRADESGIAVRNVIGDTMLPWPVVRRIAFPPGAHWAQVVLADDDVISLLAIQAMDKQRAVSALRDIRALHARFAPPAPELSADAAARARRRAIAEAAAAAARPLGRLEQIDREMAEKGKTVRRRGAKRA